MTVKIEIFGENADEALTELHAFSGGLRPTQALQSSTALSGGAMRGAPMADAEADKVVSETGEAVKDREPAQTTAAAPAEEPKRGRGRPSTKKDAPQISANPENRIGPEDTPETAAQDKADEQAEVEAAREPEKPLTREDVKVAMMAYVKKFGMPATQEDGPKIYVEALGAPPAGEEYWKLSLVPDDQTALGKVVATWKKATELNPLKRTPVA